MYMKRTQGYMCRKFLLPDALRGFETEKRSNGMIRGRQDPPTARINRWILAV
jgi:hypothetical protein